MSNNSTVELAIETSFIQLDLSSSIRLTRHLFHVIILILFISILGFVSHKHYSRIVQRPFLYLSHLIVSIGIIGLVLDDFLVINGVTHRIGCSIHQIFLHLLLMAIVAGHLLPDFYEYVNQYYHQHSVSTLKSRIVISFIVLLCIQLLISIKSLWTHHHHLPNGELNPPVLCLGSIRPQLSILIIHSLDLIFTIQSIRTPMIVDDTNPISSINIFISEKLCHLNSILLRLFYFIGTSILHTLFIPGQFSATFYSGILIIELILNYFIVIYHSNIRYERGIDNPNGILRSAYLRLKTDDLNDDTRLLNDID